MYSNPNQGAFNAPHDATPKPTIVFDDEVKEILQKTYPEMINGMINLAIKRFAETNEFKEYFVRKEFREEIVVKEEAQQPNVEAPVAQSTQPQTSIPESNSSVISAVSAW
jgi:hypothetical protein